jgi:hypothetical protein
VISWYGVIVEEKLKDKRRNLFNRNKDKLML